MPPEKLYMLSLILPGDRCQHGNFRVEAHRLLRECGAGKIGQLPDLPPEEQNLLYFEATGEVVAAVREAVDSASLGFVEKVEIKQVA